MTFKLFSCVVCCLIVQEVSCKNPGMLVFMSKSTVDTFVQITLDFWIQPGLTSHAPNFTGKSELGDWKLLNLSMTPLNRPFMKTTIDDDKSVSLKVSGSTWKIAASSEIHIKGLGLTCRFPFGGTICLDGQLSFNGSKAKDNFRCKCGVSCGIDMRFGNVTEQLGDDDEDTCSHFGQLFNEIINKLITKRVNKYYCDMISSRIINTPVHSWLFGIRLNELFHVNGKGMDILQIDSRGIILATNGNVVPYINGHLESDYPDNGMKGTKLLTSVINPNTTSEYAWSNYTIATLVYTAVKRGLLDNDVLSNTWSPGKRTFYALNCMKTCIGNIYPFLSKKFPGKFVNVNLTFLENVQASISESCIVIQTSAVANFHIESFSILQLRMELTTSVVPYVVNNTILIQGKLAEFKFHDVQVLSSNVGRDVPTSISNWMLTVLSEAAIKPRIKDILDYGIDLSYNGKHRREWDVPISVTGAKVKLVKDAMVLTASLALESFP